MIGLLALLVAIAGVAAGGIGLYGVLEYRWMTGGEIFLVGAVGCLAAVIVGSIGKKLSSKTFSMLALVVGVLGLIACIALFFIYDGVEYFQQSFASTQSHVEVIWEKFKLLFQAVKGIGQEEIQKHMWWSVFR